MDVHDEQTERYLKEFRPLAIRELEVAPQSKTFLWKQLTAAAAIAACAGGVFWLSRRESTHLKKAADIQTLNTTVVSRQQPRSMLALTRLALEDDKRFETVLSEQSRTLLPNFQQEHSALKALAKD